MDYRNNTTAPYPMGQLGTGGGYAERADLPMPNVGLSQAGDIIDRLGKQLAQIYDALGQRHQMIYGPTPQAVDNAKSLGGSGLIYELSRLSDAAEQINQLASSL